MRDIVGFYICRCHCLVYVIRKKQNLYFVPKLGEILVNTSHAIGPDGKSSTMVNEVRAQLNCAIFKAGQATSTGNI